MTRDTFETIFTILYINQESKNNENLIFCARNDSLIINIYTTCQNEVKVKWVTKKSKHKKQNEMTSKRREKLSFFITLNKQDIDFHQEKKEKKEICDKTQLS